MKKNIMKGLFSIGLLVVLSACGGSAKVDLKENIEIEYGSDLKVEDLTDQEDIQLKEIKEYDNKKLGEQKVSAVFVDADEKEIEQEVTVTVKDTQAPEITFKNDTMEITLGDEIDTASNIESVKDPVDGVIKQSTDNTITQNGYFITSDVKSEAGEYTVTITAFDKNGNKAEKTYKLIIKEKSQETVSTSQAQQPVASQSGTQSQAPSQSNQSSSGSNASSGSQPAPSQPAPSQPKVVCPNGNEPDNPNLPCETFIAGALENAYKDASGNIMAFPTAEAAWDWAYDVMSNDKSFDIYSRFATVPLWRNDQTSWDGVVFFK